MSAPRGALFERLLSATLVVCAVAVAASVVYRTFLAPPPRVDARSHGPPVRVKNWADAQRVGTIVGDSSAQVTIVEFTDLQCPVCRVFQKTVNDVLSKYAHQVAVTVVLYPLSYHPQAMAAARAAVCARGLGRFAAWENAVFDKQDSLGKKAWTSFAADAGIRDTMRIAQCAGDSSSVAAITAGMAFGDKVGIDGTPTVIVNGWKLSAPPSEDALERAIDALLKGEDPFSSGSSANP